MMELVPGNCAERYIAFKNTQGQNITVEDIRKACHEVIKKEEFLFLSVWDKNKE